MSWLKERIRNLVKRRGVEDNKNTKFTIRVDVEGLVKTLIRAGVLDPTTSKLRIRCFICGNEMTLDDVGVVEVINKRLVVTCNRPPCTIEFMKFKARLIALGYKIK